MDTYTEFCIRFWEATRELDLYSMDGSQLDRLIVDALLKTNGGKELLKTSTNELSVLIKAINHNNKKIQQPSLPDNLDDAAREYEKTTFKKPYSENNEEVTIVEPDKYNGFIAGAEWRAEQGVMDSIEGTVCGRVYDHINIRYTDDVGKALEPRNISHIPVDVSKYKIGDKVIVQIRKK